MKEVILLLTNKINYNIVLKYEKLVNQVGNKYDVKLLFHAGEYSYIPNVYSTIDCIPFTNSDIKNLGYRYLYGENFFDNLNYVTIWFSKKYEYNNYWVIEDDVIFNGNWYDFFSKIPKDYDYIASYLKYKHEEPDWWYWRDFTMPDGSLVPETQYRQLRSFNPIYRLSKLAILELSEVYEMGFCGHFELTMPTFLHFKGLKMGDLGGKSFKILDTPLYLEHIHRWRPQILMEEITRPNMIYHPVKE